MRSEAEIIEDLRDVECELSPENLTCDGELPRSQVARKLRGLQARKSALVRELGREPTDKEIWGA